MSHIDIRTSPLITDVCLLITWKCWVTLLKNWSIGTSPVMSTIINQTRHCTGIKDVTALILYPKFLLLTFFIFQLASSWYFSAYIQGHSMLLTHNRQYSADNNLQLIFWYKNCFVQIDPEHVSKGQIEKYACTGWDNDLVQNSRQAIIWTNDVLV